MQVENTLSSLVVSLITLNICGVRLCLQCTLLYQSSVLLISVFIETCYSCHIAYGFMLV